MVHFINHKILWLNKKQSIKIRNKVLITNRPLQALNPSYNLVRNSSKNKLTQLPINLFNLNLLKFTLFSSSCTNLNNVFSTYNLVKIVKNYDFLSPNLLSKKKYFSLNKAL